MGNEGKRAESPTSFSVGQRPTEWITRHPEALKGRNLLDFRLSA